MTQALEAAIASAAKLPMQEQDALAALLVAEMESGACKLASPNNSDRSTQKHPKSVN